MLKTSHLFTLALIGQLFFYVESKGGPLALIYDYLNDTQKHELDAIIDKSSNGTKGDFRLSISHFFDGLSDDLKQIIRQPNKQYESIKQQIEQRVRALSPEAQEIYFKLKTIAEDDSITFAQEHDRIQYLFEHIDQSALNELQRNRIPLPGIPAPPELIKNFS